MRYTHARTHIHICALYSLQRHRLHTFRYSRLIRNVLPVVTLSRELPRDAQAGAHCDIKQPGTGAGQGGHSLFHSNFKATRTVDLSS
jgi:hypothetical protein